METGIRILLLSLACLSASGCASLSWPWQSAGMQAEAEAEAGAADDGGEPVEPGPRVIDPQVGRRVVEVPSIDAKDVEIGLLGGALSIEDFGTGSLTGSRAAYHLTEDLFIEGRYARSNAGKTSFETLSGTLELLTPAERRLSHYNLSLGYNFLPGQVYLGRGRALNSTLYLVGGMGATKFAGDQHFTLNFGGGYRVLPTDWLSLYIDVQDLVYESDLLGKRKLTNNLGAHLGVSVYF
ncbi:MAG: hypothetical protein RL026_695 [Pseudomonadota bacterium]|jgi:outer membrane beta-barrel protein